MRRRTMAVLAAAALLGAGCAAPVGSDLHKTVGQDPRQGAAALVVWLPADLKGSVWLQFERRNAQGQPTGIPTSVLVAQGAPLRDALPARPGWRAAVLAFPLAAGGHVVSRWVAEVPGDRSAVSAYLGWPFDVEAGQLTHLGQLELHLAAPHDEKVGYRLMAAAPTADGVALVRHNFEATRPLRLKPFAGLPGTVTGVARLGGTTHRVIDSSTSVYIR